MALDIKKYFEKDDSRLIPEVISSVRDVLTNLTDQEIATAIQAYAPDRAVSIWKNKAERLIAQVKPSAYQEAAKYLRKAAKIMRRERKLVEWERYLKELRQQHVRKHRLIEILDGLDGKPIVKRMS